MNHAHTVLGDDAESMLVDGFGAPKPRRTIVVLGAGASHALHGAKLARAAAETIEERLQLLHPAVKPIYEGRLKRSEEVAGLNRKQFETRLLAASELHPKRTNQVLRDLYKNEIEYRPSLGYELLAHLLNHRFVDAVVSFNFDELFDEAVEREIKDGEYVRVVSSDDCPADRLGAMRDPGRHRSLPLYFKPHGTISREETLRYTKEQYVDLPSEFKDLFATLLSDVPTTLWVIGFAMGAKDLNDAILHHAKTEGSRIVFTLPSSHTKAQIKSALGRIPLGWERYNVTAGHDLNTVIEDVWLELVKHIRPEFRPRGINRHRFLVEACKRNGAERPLRARIYFEIALAIAKAKGWTSLPSLAGGRPGHYYRKARARGSVSRPLREMVEDLGLKTFNYTPLALHLEPEKGTSWRDRTVASEKSIPRLVRDLANRVTALDRPRTRRTLERELTEVWRSDEVEMSRDAGGHLEDLFPNQPIIRTRAEFVLKTQTLLLGKYDLLICAAENGKWLLDLPERLTSVMKRRHTALVLADLRFASDLQTLFGRKLQIRQIPWWTHNLHMSISLVADGGSATKPKPAQAIEGVLFPRRLRNPRVGPIYVEGDKCLRFTNTFAAYWRRGADGFTGDIESDRDVELGRRALDDLLPTGSRYPDGPASR